MRQEQLNLIPYHKQYYFADRRRPGISHSDILNQSRSDTPSTWMETKLNTLSPAKMLASMSENRTEARFATRQVAEDTTTTADVSDLKCNSAAGSGQLDHAENKNNTSVFYGCSAVPAAAAVIAVNPTVTIIGILTMSFLIFLVFPFILILMFVCRR